jgi:hypothetical protein
MLPVRCRNPAGFREMHWNLDYKRDDFIPNGSINKIDLRPRMITSLSSAAGDRPCRSNPRHETTAAKPLECGSLLPPLPITRFPFPVARF